MAHKKLTGIAIQRCKPNPNGSRSYTYDSSFPGLCLRAGKRDKAWVYYFRVDGKLQGKTLGKYSPDRIDHMDRAGAIEAAEAIDTAIETGTYNKRKAPKPKPKPTVEMPNAFNRRVKQFLKVYKKKVKPTTYSQAERLLKSEFVDCWEHTDVSKIGRSQIVNLLEGMDDTPIQANRLHSYLSKFFIWCWDHEYVDVSPMVGLKKQHVEKSRTRNLDAKEIKQLWKACDKLGYPLGDWCKFTLATGQRPGECRKLSRADLHKDIWLVEGGDPKNDERHRIPLPKLARDIIKAAPEFTGPYVFSTTAGEKPISQGGKPYTELYKAAGIDKPWRPHDLRRTFQTIASEDEDLNIEPHLLGAICNQKSVAKPGVSSVYNQAKWMKQKKKVLEAWNKWLEKVVK